MEWETHFRDQPDLGDLNRSIQAAGAAVSFVLATYFDGLFAGLSRRAPKKQEPGDFLDLVKALAIKPEDSQEAQKRQLSTVPQDPDALLGKARLIHSLMTG